MPFAKAAPEASNAPLIIASRRSPRARPTRFLHSHKSVLTSATKRPAKTIAQPKRVCELSPWGRGNSKAIAGRSLFAVDFELGAFHCWGREI